MSLINQMLQDLEKRRASGAERGALPDQVRVLPRKETHGMPWRLIGIAAAVALFAMLIWQFNRQSSPPALPSVAQTPSPAGIAPESPASRLALDLQHVPIARPQRKAATGGEPAAPRKAVTAEGVMQPAQKSLPLTMATVVATESMATKPARAAPPPPKAEPAKVPVTLAEISKPASAPAAAPAVADKPAHPVVQESRVATGLTDPQIDKRAQILTPQQRAENDYREAANFLNQGRLADAQEGFRRALRNNPSHVGARQGLFGLLIDAKKNGEAEQLLQEGLAINLNQPGFAMALSSLQYERGDLGAAIETMQKSAPAAQASPDYLARLAGLLQRQSRHREAIENYQAALRLAPQSGVWLMGLGISLQASNRNSEAQEAFRRAKSSSSLNPELQAFVDQRLKQLQ